MGRCSAALVAFAVNGLAFWAMIVLVVLGGGIEILVGIVAALTLGLAVASFSFKMNPAPLLCCAL